MSGRFLLPSQEEILLDTQVYHATLEASCMSKRHTRNRNDSQVNLLVNNSIYGRKQNDPWVEKNRKILLETYRDQWEGHQLTIRYWKPLKTSCTAFQNNAWQILHINNSVWFDLSMTNCLLLNSWGHIKAKNHLHQPGIEPGSVPWQGTILPLDHWCFVLSRLLNTFKTNMKRNFLVNIFKLGYFSIYYLNIL